MVTVLIVEDDPSIATLLEESLESDGYKITDIASTVQEAITSIKKRQPDFAIIDLNLADGDSGVDVATYLNAMSKDTRIIISTGSDYRNCLKRTNCCIKIDKPCDCAFVLGDAVMTKPYSLNDIAKGLQIIDDMKKFGKTSVKLPRNFLFLTQKKYTTV